MGVRSPSFATVAAGCVMAIVSLAVLPSTAVGAFEREVRPAAADAVCGAGPAPELIDLLTRPERETGWCLRATSSELYGLAELRGTAASVSHASAGGYLSLGASSFGGRIYSERTIEVVGARRWPEDTATCFRGRALCMVWEGGDAVWTGALDASAAWSVHGRFIIGVSAGNATGSSVLSTPVSSPVSGDAALVLDGVMILASLTCAAGFTPSPAIGCELTLAPWLRFRAGVRKPPSSTAFGLRLEGGHPLAPGLDLAWCRHLVLGSSYSLTVSVRI